MWLCCCGKNLRKIVLVLPNDMEHVTEVLRFGQSDAERQATLEFLTEISANGVGGFHLIRKLPKILCLP